MAKNDMDTKPTHNDGLLSIKEAAAHLSVAAITIRRMIRENRLPAIRLSSTLVRIRRQDIQTLISNATA